MKPVLVVQNCAIESPGTIIDYLINKKIPYLLIHSYQNEPLPHARDISIMINTGTPVSVNDYQKYDYLKNLFGLVADVIRQDKPYLGICFGGQLLAKILGAPVSKNKIKEIGVYEVTLTNEGIKEPLFEGFKSIFPVFHWHGDTFKIPYGASVLAESVDCKNQAFRRGKAVGLQFHLEPVMAEVEQWCDAYENELDEVNKTKTDLLISFEAKAGEFKRLNFQLLDNFFNI